MHKQPRLLSVMTPFPHAIDAAASLAVAREKMRAHGVHRLPVMREREIVGVLSATQIDTAERAGGPGALDATATAYARTDVPTLDAELTLADAARTMAAHHMAVAVVTREGRLAGIVTESDVCRWLASALDAQDPPPDDIA